MTSTTTNRSDVAPEEGIKAPCKLATTANITLSGHQTIDGTLTVEDDRILVKNQTAQAENGIYLAKSSGWVRTPDFNDNTDVSSGQLIAVDLGVVGSGIYQLTYSGAIDLGTTSLSFERKLSVTSADLVNNTYLYATLTSSGTDTYTANLANAPIAYAVGQRYTFISDFANVGACTINFNGIGAASIKTLDGADPHDGAIQDSSVDLQYDGANFILLNPHSSILSLTPSDGNFAVGDGAKFVAESGATARASMGAAESGANSDITSLSAATDLAARTLVHNMASDANYTLSASENLRGQIEITDTGVALTTGRDIIVSTEARVFTAVNNTLQTLTFKTPAGAGVGVPPDERRLLLCGGVDVAPAVEKSLLVEQIVSGGAVTSIDFTGLDINKHESYRIELDLNNATASDAVIYMYVNNDTTASNYDNQSVIANGASLVAARSATPGVGTLSAGGVSGISLSLALVSGLAVARSLVSDDTGSSTNLETRSCTYSAVISNVTQLTFTSTIANSIANGSAVRIYRGDF